MRKTWSDAVIKRMYHKTLCIMSEDNHRLLLVTELVEYH